MIEQAIKEDIFNILRVLSSRENLTQRDLSQHLDFSLGKTNYLIKILIQKGFIEIKNFTEGGQKLNKFRYILTKKGFEHKLRLAYYYLKIKEKEFYDLKREVKIGRESNV
ncbi:MAG: MarR family EPS-associated transcriptional regulator [Candidatus Omnitrophota bacterium]